MGKKSKDKLRKAAKQEHRATIATQALIGSAITRALTPVAKAIDEPPLLALGIGTLALGAALRRPALARSGARMLASHLIATGLKTVMKASVDRVRPNAARDGSEIGAGHGTDDSSRNAFPSGHAAGAVAVARAVGHDMPAVAVPAQLAAGVAGAGQVARGAHYATDVAAGAAIGWVAERLASWAFGTIERYGEQRATSAAEAETEAHPS